MSTDWRRLCKGPGLSVEDDVVTVTFENQRSHRVRIQETEATIELHALVARASNVLQPESLPLRIWRHNRAAQLVGFRLDARNSVRAEGWVAKAGLEAQEFQHVLRRVASESDRFEFILTGKDTE